MYSIIIIVEEKSGVNACIYTTAAWHCRKSKNIKILGFRSKRSHERKYFAKCGSVKNKMPKVKDKRFNFLWFRFQKIKQKLTNRNIEQNGVFQKQQAFFFLAWYMRVFWGN